MIYISNKLMKLNNKSDARHVKQQVIDAKAKIHTAQMNSRADLLPFYNGSGDFEVGSAAYFFGFPGGWSWER